ncbi:MAG: group II intron reverse transcriptase/maturase, partial [Pseudomonadota bacterium]|nr:group II intron reverse transcriptase/maturase [Pseudomonadota bacterium]
QHGYKGKFAHINMTSWSSARSPLASYAMPNSWFDELGLMNLESVETGYVFSNYAK